MERGSDKHGRIVDDDLKQTSEPMERGRPTPAHVEDFRVDEDLDRGSPAIEPDENGRLDPDEVEARSDLARHLRPSAFPGDRASLLEAAREENAPAWLLRALERLPDGETFENVQDVWRALGGAEDAPVDEEGRLHRP